MLKKWIEAGDRDVLLVHEEKGKIACFITAMAFPSGTALISGTAVAQGMRGKGAGRMLYEKCMEELEKRGTGFVYCWVNAGEKKSREYWRKKGFKEGKKFIFSWKQI